MGTLTVTVYAAVPGNYANRIDGRITALQQRQQQMEEQRALNEAKREQFKTKQQEFAAFRSALAEKRDQMMANRDTNADLRQQNIALRLEYAQALKAVRDSGNKLTDETLASLKDLNGRIKDIMTSVKDTNGQIRDVMSANKEATKNKDYVAMNEAFGKAFNIQQWRNEQIMAINGLLQQMIDLLK